MAELAAIEERHRQRENHNDWRTALIICTLCNLQRGKDDKVLQPADIMPWLKTAAEAKAPEPQINRELLEACNAALGGTAKIIGTA